MEKMPLSLFSASRKNLLNLQDRKKERPPRLKYKKLLMKLSLN